MLALAPQTRNKFKACLRPGRLREMNLKQACGPADYEKWIQNRLSAVAEAKADWSPNGKQIKNTIPFLLLFKLTPLFGNALIRYFDLTFIYKKKVAFFSRQPFSLYNPEKLFSAQSLLMYYCLRPKQLLLSRVLCAFRKQCRHSPFCSSPKYHPNHRY